MDRVWSFVRLLVAMLAEIEASLDVACGMDGSPWIEPCVAVDLDLGIAPRGCHWINFERAALAWANSGRWILFRSLDEFR